MESAKETGPGGTPLTVVQTLMETRATTDPAAFFDQLYPPVVRFLGAATGAPAEDVEDLAQETLIHAWRDRSRHRGEGSLLTWVLAIARNRARMRVRAAGRRTERERVARALAAVDTEIVPSDLLETEELVGQVRQALLDVDPDYAGVLVRRYCDGASVREIAGETGETEKAVESRLHRAREAMRRRLKRGEDHGSG